MNLLSWNVNGIRAVHKKGFMDWFSAENPDILCLQEVRADVNQIPQEILEAEGYHSFWNPATSKKGYAGTGIITKQAPESVFYGLDNPDLDADGRVLGLSFADFHLLSVYVPSISHNIDRLGFKIDFCEALLAKCVQLNASKPVVFCGDMNVAHHAIDLANPKANLKNPGFLPEERAILDRFQSAGFTDAFRHFHPEEAGAYTWWSQRGNVRERNIGWRLDYFWVSQDFLPRLKDGFHLPNVMGSDHAPCGISIHQ
jgi:exodeoxyribonuclease III